MLDNQSARYTYLDVLKGLAICAIMLYHFGGNLFPYGYLGVEIFFVVSGYLLTKTLLKSFQNNSFSYWKFVIHKLVRLWPLVLIVSGMALLIGYFCMLPDDYENLAQSAFASAIFANNILQCITTKNYWDIVNLYKPLMHMWYIGVLMQSFLFLPLVYQVCTKCYKNIQKGLLVGGIILTLLSLGLFLFPSFTAAQKFYYFPFRLFEITSGSLLALGGPILSKRFAKFLFWSALISLVGLLCNRFIISTMYTVLATVFATLLFIYAAQTNSFLPKPISYVLTILGKRSYSLFIWHQFVIAFLFYSVFQTQNTTSFITYICISGILSEISYRFIEQYLSAKKSPSHEYKIFFGCVLGSIMICTVSWVIYLRAGIVRNVEELDISTQNIHRGMHAEYVDRPFRWDKKFLDPSKKHILVIGNSFGRDWANILNEYDTKHTLEIVYFSSTQLTQHVNLVTEADFVFFAVGPEYRDVPGLVLQYVPLDKLFIVGNKNFGASNGIIYAKKHSKHYFLQKVSVPQELLYQNSKMAKIYGTRYIDMLKPVLDNDKVLVFTDTHKFISQDCRHLTQAGAQFYAKILDIDSLLTTASK